MPLLEPGLLGTVITPCPPTTEEARCPFCAGPRLGTTDREEEPPRTPVPTPLLDRVTQQPMAVDTTSHLTEEDTQAER